jgi:hypothetical protein
LSALVLLVLNRMRRVNGSSVVILAA